MAQHAAQELLETGEFSTGTVRLINIPGQGAAFGWSNGTPTGSVAGAAKGCIVIDYANGVVYKNTGTTASATWTDIGMAAGTDDFGASGILTDVITESTGDAGITAEAVLLKDGDVNVTDANDIILGTGTDAKLRWSTADADNHAAVLALGQLNQVLHIAESDDVATDWNVGANAADSEIRIHSSTTPATDYMTIGRHTGTVASIDVVGGTTLQLEIGSTAAASITATALTMVAGGSVGADIVSEVTAGAGVTADSVHLKDGQVRQVQAAPTAKTTSAGLEAAEILVGLVTVTHSAGANQDYQLPLGTELEALVAGTNESFDWSIINLSGTPATNTATITVDTGHTIVGSAVVGDSANASGQFRTRRSGANSFVTYRLA